MIDRLLARLPGAFSVTLILAMTLIVAPTPVIQAAEWEPGHPETALSGLIPAPADIPGLGRWQVMMRPISGYVESAVYSPDCDQVAFGDGHYIRIHDAMSLDLIRVLVGHSGNVRSVSWSPDGNWLASGSDDGTVRLWKSDGVPAGVLQGHTAAVRCVTWHPQSQSLASASIDGTIRLWDIAGTAGVVINGHESPVISIDWSPDGELIAAGDENRTVRYWKPNGEPGAVLEGHLGEITHVRWSPDGKWVASTSMGLVPKEPGEVAIATTRLWHSDGSPGPVLEGHDKAIRALAWSPDSEQIITASEDRRTLLWSTDGTMIHEVSNIQTGIRGNVFSLDWHAVDDRILAGGRFSVHFFDSMGPTGPENLLRPHGGKLMHLDWHPSEDKIAVGADDATVYIWSGGFREQVIIDDYRSFVGCVKWSPDGQQLATISTETAVRVWSPEGQFISEFDGQGGVPRGLSWSPDGQRLAVAVRYQASHIFDADGNDVSIDVHEGGLAGVSFSPDGNQLATAGLDANVKVLQVGDESVPPKEVALMQAFDGDVDCIAWSPDGKWIASGHESSVCLWQPDGTPGPVISAGDSAILRIDWTPDSQRLVTGSWDTSVRLWSVEGELLKELPGHTAPCWGACFSPNGKQLATCGWDGVARIVDVESEQILAIAIHVAEPGQGQNGRMGVDHHAIAFNRAGQVTFGNPEILEQQFVYLVEQPSGAFAIIKPSEFQAKAPGAIMAAAR